MNQWITAIVDDAVSDLQAALRVYWPADGLNEMAEAQALGAIGRAFGRAGFHVFPEASCRGRGRLGHVDLVAISPRRLVCVAVEGKRLYDGRGCSCTPDEDQIRSTIVQQARIPSWPVCP